MTNIRKPKKWDSTRKEKITEKRTQNLSASNFKENKRSINSPTKLSKRSKTTRIKKKPHRIWHNQFRSIAKDTRWGKRMHLILSSFGLVFFFSYVLCVCFLVIFLFSFFRFGWFFQFILSTKPTSRRKAKTYPKCDFSDSFGHFVYLVNLFLSLCVCLCVCLS